MKISLPIVFSQFDSRWAQLPLGFNTSSRDNFYNFACLISDQASICKYYGFDENPLTLNDKYKALGTGVGFQAGSGNYVYGALSKIHPEITERRVVTPNLLTDGQVGEIFTAIDAGYVVIVQLDFNPKTVELNSHFVMIVDYDPNDENNCTIADPLGGRIHSLKDYLGYFYPTLRKTITQYIIYSGPVPKHGEDMMLVPKSVYPDIIHGSTEWDKVVSNLLPDSDSKHTQFEDVQKVISGIKSYQTTLQGQVTDLVQQLATAQQAKTNAEEASSSLKAQLSEVTKQKDIEISTLSKQANLGGVVTEQLKGSLQAKQTQMDDAIAQKGQALIELAACKATLPTAQPTAKINNTVFQAIFNFITDRLHV